VLDNDSAAFVWDNSAVLDPKSDCTLTVAPTGEFKLPETAAFRITAACVAQRFPGTAVCNLTVTADAGDNYINISTPQVTFGFIGIIIYDLAGIDPLTQDVTRDSQIYSGTGRSFSLDTFDVVDTEPRILGVRVILPGGIRARERCWSAAQPCKSLDDRGFQVVFL
jgi:hypothetical protein